MWLAYQEWELVGDQEDTRFHTNMFYLKWKIESYKEEWDYNNVNIYKNQLLKVSKSFYIKDIEFILNNISESIDYIPDIETLNNYIEKLKELWNSYIEVKKYEEQLPGIQAIYFKLKIDRVISNNENPNWLLNTYISKLKELWNSDKEVRKYEEQLPGIRNIYYISIVEEIINGLNSGDYKFYYTPAYFKSYMDQLIYLWEEIKQKYIKDYCNGYISKVNQVWKVEEYIKIYKNILPELENIFKKLES